MFGLTWTTSAAPSPSTTSPSPSSQGSRRTRRRSHKTATVFTSLLLASSAAASSLYFSDAAAELHARQQHLSSHHARAQYGESHQYSDTQHARRGLPMGASVDSTVKRAIGSTGQFASSGFDYVNDKVRGVNLGNWLVLEPWMDQNASNVLNANAINAPGNHVVIDEYTMGLYLDPDFLGQFFQEHLGSWITEDDFRQIAAAGLNHVRIPIGHWAFPDCIEAGVAYQPLNRFDLLKQGVRWAQKYNIKVWIDLHGTPGSQNGYPGSGRAGVAHWPNNATYIDMTEKAFNYLVAEFTQDTYKGTVTAIQPVNEPVGAYSKPVQNLVNTYYPWAWQALAYPQGNAGPISNTMLVTHDAWQGLAYWQNFYNAQQSERVIMDAHPYFVYGPQEVNASDSFRLNEVCQYGTKISQSQRFYPTVAGEWSIGAPNGDNFPVLRDLPASDQVIFPYTNKYPFTQRYMQFLAINFRAQQQVFEEGTGWMFWNWKHLAFADQSYQTGIKYGWLPSNARELNDQPFGQLCVNDKFAMSKSGVGGSAGGPSSGAVGSARFVGAGALLALVSGAVAAVSLL
ncbi:unnamed protein product [Tilletia controversa]|uniref:Glycoside hydrolase family 5 domain-containing protein n=3 Tax=Tilletia TaxID=13289 RepID=A0A8X7MQK3_9BASI|nr:hypothetical protein CF328_g8516 [Tilletia controversa]KAE8190109.1 hypothetical protein CF336_g5447 [Tilletia laevis]KAE8256954.1 hypothetical protein A4X03_0g4892 [Tilletia caries]KAE8197750.1 hypothetical protein CF335_g4542 [Tilletia laevis]KAE8245381.1 hypothetical protein A4X06_0g5711 [Tilletia controversa]